MYCPIFHRVGICYQVLQGSCVEVKNWLEKHFICFINHDITNFKLNFFYFGGNSKGKELDEVSQSVRNVFTYETIASGSTVDTRSRSDMGLISNIWSGFLFP